MNPTQLHRANLSAYQQAVSKRFEGAPGGLAGPITQPQRGLHHAAASPSSNFQWDDAGIGAAGMLGSSEPRVPAPSSTGGATSTRHPRCETTEASRGVTRGIRAGPGGIWAGTATLWGRPSDAANLSSLA